MQETELSLCPMDPPRTVVAHPACFAPAKLPALDLAPTQRESGPPVLGLSLMPHPSRLTPGFLNLLSTEMLGGVYVADALVEAWS